MVKTEIPIYYGGFKQIYNQQKIDKVNLGNWFFLII